MTVYGRGRVAQEMRRHGNAVASSAVVFRAGRGRLRSSFSVPSPFFVFSFWCARVCVCESVCVCVRLFRFSFSLFFLSFGYGAAAFAFSLFPFGSLPRAPQRAPSCFFFSSLGVAAAVAVVVLVDRVPLSLSLAAARSAAPDVRPRRSHHSAPSGFSLFFGHLADHSAGGRLSSGPRPPSTSVRPSDFAGNQSVWPVSPPGLIRLRRPHPHRPHSDGRVADHHRRFPAEITDNRPPFFLTRVRKGRLFKSGWRRNAGGRRARGWARPSSIFILITYLYYI